MVILLIQTFVLLQCLLFNFTFFVSNHLGRYCIFQIWNIIRTGLALVFKMNQPFLRLKLRVIMSGLSLGLSSLFLDLSRLFQIRILKFMQLALTHIFVFQILIIVMQLTVWIYLVDHIMNDFIVILNMLINISFIITIIIIKILVKLFWKWRTTYTTIFAWKWIIYNQIVFNFISNSIIFLFSRWYLNL